MRAYTGLDSGSSAWDVSLKGPFDGTNGMGEKEDSKREDGR